MGVSGVSLDWMVCRRGRIIHHIVQVLTMLLLSISAGLGTFWTEQLIFFLFACMWYVKFKYIYLCMNLDIWHLRNQSIEEVMCITATFWKCQCNLHLPLTSNSFLMCAWDEICSPKSNFHLFRRECKLSERCRRKSEAWCYI